MLSVFETMLSIFETNASKAEKLFYQTVGKAESNIRKVMDNKKEFNEWDVTNEFARVIRIMVSNKKRSDVEKLQKIAKKFKALTGSGGTVDLLADSKLTKKDGNFVNKVKKVVCGTKVFDQLLSEISIVNNKLEEINKDVLNLKKLKELTQPIFIITDYQACIQTIDKEIEKLKKLYARLDYYLTERSKHADLYDKVNSIFKINRLKVIVTIWLKALVTIAKEILNEKETEIEELIKAVSNEAEEQEKAGQEEEEEKAQQEERGKNDGKNGSRKRLPKPITKKEGPKALEKEKNETPPQKTKRDKKRENKEKAKQQREEKKKREEKRAEESQKTIIDIPNGTTEIKKSEYSGFKCTTVNVPTGVKTIGKEAFSECHNLKTIELPSSVTTIDNFAFSECTSLNTFKIPKSVTAIGRGVFQVCTNLTEMDIPENVKSIKNNCFSGCTKLKKVTIAKGVKGILDNAFKGCSSLKELNMPEDIKFFGNPFSQCDINKFVINGKNINECNIPAIKELLHPKELHGPNTAQSTEKADSPTATSGEKLKTD